MANEITLASDVKVLIPSKENAKNFYGMVRAKIMDTGENLFEFLEFLKFIAKVQEEITGTYDPSTGKGTLPDKEFRDYVRAEIEKYGKGGYTTSRGAKFELMEAGYQYHYDKCNDPVYARLLQQFEELKAKVKERETFLKGLSTEGMDLLDEETGEIPRVYPPYRTSTSTYKVTLPK